MKVTNLRINLKYRCPNCGHWLKLRTSHTKDNQFLKCDCNRIYHIFIRGVEILYRVGGNTTEEIKRLIRLYMGDIVIDIWKCFDILHRFAIISDAEDLKIRCFFSDLFYLLYKEEWERPVMEGNF